MMIKKIITTLLMVWVIANVNVSGSKLLKSFIVEGKWDELPSIFQDDSFKTLKNYFSTSKSIKIITSEGNKLTYKAKFSHQGEIGVITFDFQGDKYSNIQIRNQIQPLYFIEKFRKYKAADIRFSVGDAQLHFISGYFYETIPFQSLLLFEGKWRFYIKPGDREEQLTLNRIYNKEYFSQSNKAGIFILPEKDFLKKLTSMGHVKSLDKETQSLFKLYRNAFGIKIKQFDEYWYLPFPQGTHLLVFKKDKDSFYYYSYNNSLVPDTRLLESRNNDMILNYNAHPGMKLSFGGQENVSNLKLNIFFNPKTNFISGTTTISYKEPTSLKTLDVAAGLKLVGNLNMDAKGLNVFRKRNTYYLLGTESDKLSLYFRGQVKPEKENFELFKDRGEGEQAEESREDEEEPFYFLSKTDDFYPNPGDDFFETQLTVTLPGRLNCLASGHLLEKTEGDPATYKYNSVNSKGISLVVGNFLLAKSVAALVPLQFYTPKGFPLPRDLDLQEIKEGFNFFTRLFGALDLPCINILLRPAEQEGGISNNGFLVVNIFDKKRKITMGNKKILSPILIRESPEDYILHELAHQWWGGVISWKSYQDNWITEGLAHLSLLYYLKKKMPEKQFDRFIKKIKRWVYRYSDSGPIIYGTRIHALENRYEPYQSVVYNKTALLFLMVMEWIGEEEFNQRLKSVLDEFKYKSITSMQFIRKFCDKNTMLMDFFRKWIYSRAIPEVELAVLRDDPDFDAKEFKKVVLSITQLDTDFIFPLKLKITTQKGSSIESIVMKKKEQKFIFTRDSSIRSITIEDGVTPVKEKKTPPTTPNPVTR